MFDEQDYYSEEEGDSLQIARHTPAKKTLVPNSGSDFNHLTGESESLLKMMQERGLDVNENETRKLKAHNSSKEKEVSKPKQKAGFFDGGASASLQELLKALNKALSGADPQQASAILTHILDKKGLSEADRNKFGIMKCRILFGLGAYKDCQAIAESLLEKSRRNHLVAATLSNYLAKAKGELALILDGYMDFLRAKAHLETGQQDEKQRAEKAKNEKNQQQKGKQDEFQDSEWDTLTRQIDHTEMEYNIRMSKYKNSTNLVFPYFPQLRHRQVLQVACGDYHTLFLVGGSLGRLDCQKEVLGVGENTVGQILGKSSKDLIKQPVVLVELSGKDIQGLAATRESSLAWDSKGQIYEWGIKEYRNEEINVTYSLNERIQQLQKGYQHYAALTTSGKFYTWGSISFKGSPIYRQAQPFQQPAQNTVSVACGSSHVVAVDSYGDVFVMGSNEHGQLGLQGELHAKQFKKLNTDYIGKIRKSVCIAETTFLITRDEELYFTGRISHNRQPIQKLRQGEFTGDIRCVASLAGCTGQYYLTNEVGQLYHWDVDSSVKFKPERENERIAQRYVAATRSHIHKVRSMVVPELTKIKMLTQDLRSYEDIQFQLQLFDRLGPFANPNFVVAPRCQVFLSTYAIKGDQLEKQNRLFLESYQFSGDDSKVLINEIIQNRLASLKLSRDEQEPWSFRLTITSQESGKFYFYVLLEERLVFSQELSISVSESERELSDKNKRQKQVREEERKRKAELERQRLLEQKQRKEQEEEERRRETQKRAEEAFKKYMRQQEELKQQAEEDRKARKELVTGGGFDLSKLRAKNEKNQKIETMERSDLMQKSTESFLPDINARPNSRRKVNIPAKNSLTMTGFDSVKPFERQSSKIQDLGSTGVQLGAGLNLFKSESNKEKEKGSTAKGADSLNKTGTVGGGVSGKVVLRRGLSKGKK